MAFRREAVERDPRLEESYSFHRSHPRETVLAHVAANRDQLIADYFDWVTEQPFQETYDAMLPRFEVDRFGKELEPVAHGLLAFALRWREEKFKYPPDSLFSSNIERDTVEAAAAAALESPIEGEGSEAMVRRIAISSGLLPPDAPKRPLVKSMPEAPVTEVTVTHETWVGEDAEGKPKFEAEVKDAVIEAVDSHAEEARVDHEVGDVDHSGDPPEPGGEPDDDDFWLEPDA